MSKDSTPTNTSELATRLRQKQESERREIETLLSEHADKCRQLSAAMLSAFENDMEALRSQTRRRIRQSVWPLATIWTLSLLAAAAVGGWTYWQTHTLASQHQEIVQRRQTLAKLPDLKYCGSRRCVQIDPTAPQTWGNYRILAGY